MALKFPGSACNFPASDSVPAWFLDTPVCSWCFSGRVNKVVRLRRGNRSVRTGRYLVRAAALCGDLINRNSLSHPWSTHLGGQINFLLPSVFAAEMSCKMGCVFLHSFFSVNYLKVLFCLCSLFQRAHKCDWRGRPYNLTNKSLLALDSSRWESLNTIWIFTQPPFHLERTIWPAG